ncbi:platelet-activating factor acetylhydrolase [Synchiropus splendidus]|uniref:platelet-activating factor acetylhydrolase n=1 Tax=Synchiropus splendidus TaxID=270530 RepID=UPI00237EC206|nr:platelet-activating factor acetylhydrolase [Synchiropus splendidus]
MLTNGRLVLWLTRKTLEWRRTTGRSRRELRSVAAMGSSCSQLGVPPPRGPRHVGCTDLMMGHTAQGCFFRLYYPCEETGKTERPSWIPCREYFNGLADFMKLNRTFTVPIFHYMFGSFKIPAMPDAPFKSNEKYPVVIFSHGLGAFRTLYSTICVELASQGFIVASVEHRDSSASATYYCHEATQSETMVLKSNALQEWMYYRALQQGEKEFPLRNQQVKLRAKECVDALETLAEINSGKQVTNDLQTHFDWTTLENSMDLSKVSVMGHSFGGATVIQALSQDDKFKCGVALDTWMLPVDDETIPKVRQPIFFINSERFQWPSNICRMRKLDSDVVERKMITIRGTVHQSFPDFTFMTGNLIGKWMKLKGAIDPHVAMDLSNKATLAFLQRHLGLKNNFNQWDRLIDGDDENLIPGTNVTLQASL